VPMRKLGISPARARRSTVFGETPSQSATWRVVSSECVSFKTTACSTPEVPLARVIGEATSTKSYAVEWDVVPGAARYEVDEATSLTFADAATTVVNQGTSVTFAHEVSEPKAYFYRVRAIADCGNTPGPYSIPIRVVIVPPPAASDKNPVFNIPVGSQIDGDVCIALLGRFEFRFQKSNRHQILIEIHLLISLDREHETLFGLDGITGRGRQCNVHAPIQHRCGHHKDDQQDQHHIDEWNDIDLGEKASVTAFKNHPRIPTCFMRASTVFSSSMLKASTLKADLRIRAR